MNPQPSIRDQLGRAARERDRATRSAAVLSVVAALGLVLLAAAVADYDRILPAGTRWIFLAVLGLLAIGGGVLWVRLSRRRTSLKSAALEVEGVRPDVGCEVSTAVEYVNGERRISREFEQDLVDALQQRAALTVAQAPLRPGRRLLWPGIAAGASVVALGVFLTTVPAAGTAIRRIVTPWSGATYARVAVTPGSMEVPVGSPLVITGRFSGRQPEVAELQMREASGGGWRRVPLTRGTNGVFTHSIESVAAPMVFRIAGLDAVSGEVAIQTFVPPAVKDLRVRLDPPAYTGLRPMEQASADITVVRGSRAVFQVVPTVPLSKAQLRFTNGTVVALTMDGGRRWSGELAIQRDAEFRLELLDERGRRGGDERAHHITAVPDAPPKVDFTDPGQDIRAAATNRVPLKLTASDDFGVAGVRIFFHRLGAPEQPLDGGRWTRKGTEVSWEGELDLGTMKLNEFELVAYHAVATDNNTLDGPGIGRSPTYFIEITDIEGGKCLSQGKGQKVNLLVIQKQIIADTTALPESASADQFRELATRQRDALEFGKLYQKALTQTGAPLEAQGMMNSAVASMEKAAAALGGSKRGAALPPEESALSSLYQVVGLMPQLKSLPTVAPPSPPSEQSPPALKVVLEAIQKRKETPPDTKELARLLEEVRQLSRQQAGLNAASRNAGQSPGGSASGSGSSPGQGSQPGEGAKPGNPSKPGDSSKPGEGGKPGELGALAQKQETLSAEARALAERILRTAGKGSRLGHGAGQRVGQAAARMGQAAQAMRGGKGETAGTAGDQSASSLGAAATMLEDLLSGRPELSDVTSEEAPKQYEADIADYFKRLSKAE